MIEIHYTKESYLKSLGSRKDVMISERESKEVSKEALPPCDKKPSFISMIKRKLFKKKEKQEHVSAKNEEEKKHLVDKINKHIVKVKTGCVKLIHSAQAAINDLITKKVHKEQVDQLDIPKDSLKGIFEQKPDEQISAVPEQVKDTMPVAIEVPPQVSAEIDAFKKDNIINIIDSKLHADIQKSNEVKDETPVTATPIQAHTAIEAVLQPQVSAEITAVKLDKLTEFISLNVQEDIQKSSDIKTPVTTKPIKASPERKSLCSCEIDKVLVYRLKISGEYDVLEMRDFIESQGLVTVSTCQTSDGSTFVTVEDASTAKLESLVLAVMQKRFPDITYETIMVVKNLRKLESIRSCRKHHRHYLRHTVRVKRRTYPQDSQ